MVSSLIRTPRQAPKQFTGLKSFIFHMIFTNALLESAAEKMLYLNQWKRENGCIHEAAEEIRCVFDDNSKTIFVKSS